MLVHGEVRPIVRSLSLTSAAGTQDIPNGPAGTFIVALPDGPAVQQLAATDPNPVVNASDANGNTLAEYSVRDLLTRTAGSTH